MNLKINQFKKTSIFLLLTLFVFSCSKTDDNKTNEEVTLLEQSANDIVFGKVYGLCEGDCRDLFLVTLSGVYEDTDNSTEDFTDTQFNGTALANSKFQFAKSLLQIPSIVKESENEAVSAQTVSDVDFYLQIKTATGFKTWFFDVPKDDADSEIKEYFLNIKAVTNNLLNE